MSDGVIFNKKKMENSKRGQHKLETPSLLHTTNCNWQFVYEPAEDTFLMLDALEKDLDFILFKEPKICLEVGSGSGVLITALSKALHSTAHCLAVDINTYACKLTQSTSISSAVSIDIVEGDLTTCFRKSVIDMIIFNPPYVVTPSEELESGDCLSKSWAGGENGRQVIDRFLKTLNEVLDSYGFGYILLLKENDPQDVINILERDNFEALVLAYRKLRGEELFIIKFIKKA